MYTTSNRDQAAKLQFKMIISNIRHAILLVWSHKTHTHTHTHTWGEGRGFIAGNSGCFGNVSKSCTLFNNSNFGAHICLHRF